MTRHGPDWINTPRWKAFRRIVPHKVRVAIGALFWALVAVPVYITIGIALGVKDGWKEVVDLWWRAR